MRQIFGEIRWEAKAAVFLGLIVLFSVVGPFGSYEVMTLAERFTYWTIIMIGIGFFMHVAITLALTSTHIVRWPSTIKVAIGAMIAALPGAAIVEFVDEIFRTPGISIGTLARTWLQISVVGFLVGIIEYLNWRGTGQTAQTAALTAFHKRLSPELGTDLISMSMQDHYVEVTTTLGREMVLMRFSDALKEVAAVDGLRIHRSHWAAIPHCQHLHKAGPKAILTLSDGRDLPVSATYHDALRAALNRAA